MRIVFFMAVSLVPRVSSRILLLHQRTTNWSKKWHKERDRKNGRERGGKKRKSKIKIQDGFQVLVIVLNETTLYFI